MTGPNIAAVLEKGGVPLKITTRPVPTPGPNEVVIRNHAIAVNPADWKIQDTGLILKNYPTVLGSDSSGIITAVGSNVTKFQHGDRILGFAGVIYLDQSDHGSWQTYTLLRDAACTKIPDSMSFAEGSVFPMAFTTAAEAIFVDFAVPKPTTANEDIGGGKGFLVWGASSSVGTAAVQLARKLGFKVFATASAKHHETVKKLGATQVFDYRDSNVIKNLVTAAKESNTTISLALDSISEGTTSQQSAEIVLASAGSSEGGKVAILNPWPENVPRPEGVEVRNTFAFKAFTEDVEMGRWFFNEYLEGALADGSIVPAPEVELIKGGLEKAQEALDRSRKGVSGKKIVVELECDH